MSMRQQFMMCVLGFSLLATLGATAAQDLTPVTGRSQNGIWLDPSASNRLLASRLNVTIIAKTPRTLQDVTGGI